MGTSQLPCGMWDLPKPWIESVTPSLAGRFLTSGPPGKPQSSILDWVVRANLSDDMTSERPEWSKGTKSWDHLGK